jgi:hypothetical protein
MDDLDKIKKRAKVFLELDTPVHIVTKDDTWINGYIVSVYDDYFVVLDRVDGEIPIFYADVDKFNFFTGDVTTLKKIEGKDGNTRA